MNKLCGSQLESQCLPTTTFDYYSSQEPSTTSTSTTTTTSTLSEDSSTLPLVFSSTENPADPRNNMSTVYSTISLVNHSSDVSSRPNSPYNNSDQVDLMLIDQTNQTDGGVVSVTLATSSSSSSSSSSSKSFSSNTTCLSQSTRILFYVLFFLFFTDSLFYCLWVSYFVSCPTVRFILLIYIYTVYFILN